MATLVRNFAPVFPAILGNFLNDFERVAPAHQQSFPAVNILETEESFQIELAAPGLKKEDFKVNIHENTLTISTEKTIETTGKYNRREFNFSTFKRSFTLPKTVDSEQIVATYTDGVLGLALPKKEEAKPKEPRSIEIA